MTEDQKHIEELTRRLRVMVFSRADDPQWYRNAALQALRSIGVDAIRLDWGEESAKRTT